MSCARRSVLTVALICLACPVALAGLLKLSGTVDYEYRDGSIESLSSGDMALYTGNEEYLRSVDIGPDGYSLTFDYTPDGSGYYFRVYAKRWSSVLRVRVLPSGGEYAYWHETATFYETEGEWGWPIRIRQTDPMIVPFWLLGDASSAIWFWTDLDDDLQSYDVEWLSTDHTPSVFGPDGYIHISANDPLDNADTVMRLAALSAFENKYGSMPLVGCDTSDLFAASTAECAFMEALADWTAAFANGLGGIRSPSGVLTDLEAPTWGDGHPYGDTVPARVAGALIDLEDARTDGHDHADFTPTDIKDVVNDAHPHTMAEFWAAWKAAGKPTHLAVKALYQNTIDYNTAPTFGGLPDKSMTEGGTLPDAINLYSYASDPESADSELLFEVYNAPAECGVSIDATGKVDIVPDQNWCGNANVTIACSDGIRTKYDTFTLTSTCVNDGPTISPIPDTSVNEDSTNDRKIDLWNYGNDVDNPDSELTFSIFSNSEPNCGLSLDSGRYLDVFPTANWNGISTVMIKVQDPAGLTAFDTFNLTIKAVNDAPVLAGIPNRSLAEDGSLDNTIDLRAYTTDIDDAPANFIYAIIGNTDERCGVTIDGGRYIDINPADDWDGYSDVTIRVRDAGGLTDTDVFRVTVTGSNDPPVVSVPDLMSQKGQSVDNLFYAGTYAVDPESDPDELAYQLTSLEPKAGVTLGSDGWVDIKPAEGWTGYTDITLRATDPGGLWDEDTFRIIVASIYPGVAEARNNNDGSWVGTVDKVVSAVFSDRFYVQDQWRAAGMCVQYAPGPPVGSRVRFAGTLSTASNGERRLTPLLLDTYGTLPLRPLIMRNDSLGGASPYSGTPEIPMGRPYGAYNEGLLVRTMGKVVEHGAGSTFYLWDGTGVYDSWPGNAWLLVDSAAFGYRPPLGTFVKVTGVSSVTLVGGKTVRQLLPRSAADIEHAAP